MGEVNKTNSYTGFYYHFFCNILIISIPVLVISALILSLPHSSADTTTVDSVSFDLKVSCTISSNVTTAHRAEINGGQHKIEVGETKVSTYCNDNNGYNIYAIGSSGNTDGNTDLISSVGEGYNIKTGLYNDGATISSWGMKLTAGTGIGSESERTPPTINNGYNNYNVIPSVYTMVASRPSGTNMDMDANPDVTGSYFTTTYDIYASSVQPAGSYEGKVKYIMTHPNTNAPSTLDGIDGAFALAGKQKAYQDSEGSYYAMQDMTSSICNSVIGTGESTTARLVDMRDKNLYYVTKEKDGNCWMTQNLDLKLNDPNTWHLTSENTDISDDPTVYTTTPYATGYTVNNGVYTWAPSNTTSDAIVDYTNNTIDGTWTHSYIAPASAEGGDTYIYTNGATGSDPDIIYSLLQACIEANHTAADSDCRHYHVGNYYNWTAAIASNNSNNFSTNYNNAVNSICPKGWRLPIATDANNESRDFGDLLVAQGIMNSTTTTSYLTNGFINIRKAPLWFVRLGYINNGTLYNAALSGNYWSSTVSGNFIAYDLGFSTQVVKPAETIHLNRYYGGSIRCLARRAGE